MNGIKPSWKNIIFLVSAPSGAGKTTLCDKLQKEFRDIHYAVTATTRAPREGEVDGKSYYFMTREGFEKRLGEEGFARLNERIAAATPMAMAAGSDEIAGPIVMLLDPASRVMTGECLLLDAGAHLDIGLSRRPGREL